MEDRLVSGSTHEEDHKLDTNLRPKNLSSYVGQDGIKNTLSIYLTFVHEHTIRQPNEQQIK